MEVESCYAAGNPSFEIGCEDSHSESIHDDVAQQIRTALDRHLMGRIRQLRILATEHLVILSGACSSYYTKQLAQHVAMEQLGKKRLVNNIAVLPAK
jgi:hypothetical protein